MSKSRKSDKKKIEAALAGLPESDRKFIAVFGALLDIFGERAFRFRELPEQIQQALQEMDDDTRFNVAIECLGLILKTPILDRIKRDLRKKAQSTKIGKQTRRTGRVSFTATSRHLNRRK